MFPEIVGKLLYAQKNTIQLWPLGQSLSCKQVLLEMVALVPLGAVASGAVPVGAVSLPVRPSGHRAINMTTTTTNRGNNWRNELLYISSDKLYRKMYRKKYLKFLWFTRNDKIVIIYLQNSRINTLISIMYWKYRHFVLI